jgi:hypothetical protein
VTPRGDIHARGGAPQLCNGELSTCSGFVPSPYGQIMAVAGTPTGQGFWAVGYDRKVWTAGDAQSYGDAQNSGSIATGIAVTPSGHGYCISIADGGVYCRGDAPFYGSHPDTLKFTTGIAFSFDQNGNVNGYWLVVADGGVFTYGAAPFWGSSGGNDNEVTTIVSFPQPGQNPANPQTAGYGWIDAEGRLTVLFRPHVSTSVSNTPSN